MLNIYENIWTCRFLQFGKGQAWNISRIEDTFLESMTLLRPDMACRTHTALERLIDLGTETIDDVEWSTVRKYEFIFLEISKFLAQTVLKSIFSQKNCKNLVPKLS